MITIDWNEKKMESNLYRYRLFRHVGLEIQLIIDDVDIIGGAYCQGKHFFQSIYAAFQYLDPQNLSHCQLGYIPDNQIRVDSGAKFILNTKTGDSTQLEITYTRVDMINKTRHINVSFKEFVEATLTASDRFIKECLNGQSEREQEPDFIALVRDRDLIEKWYHQMWDNT